ncbi:flagellar hook-length control protein FliK [Consotaella salsifontis]|uniref:Flagellar hook-length control protein FliK n=1 Tax=Consotaella salsifontis TaxID=1365950 RepID=A0A1T4NSH0_9HYPH|nr:flagellar hook-length control protein FliK [Consotaella salsifontis]SJZ82006.1 Flagellar hook-length control protein FliK [Consotaella salsifontis]
MTIAVAAAAIDGDAVKAVDGRGSQAHKKTAGKEFDSALGQTMKDAASSGGKTKAAREKAPDDAADADASAADGKTGEAGRTFGIQLAGVLCAGYMQRAEGLGRDIVKPAPTQDVDVPSASVGTEAAAEDDMKLGADELKRLVGLASGLANDDGVAALSTGPTAASDPESLDALSLSLGAKVRAAIGEDGEAPKQVRVDVVHMETHFEPNEDQQVVLDNASSARNFLAGNAARSGDETQVDLPAVDLPASGKSGDAPSESEAGAPRPRDARGAWASFAKALSSATDPDHASGMDTAKSDVAERTARTVQAPVAAASPDTGGGAASDRKGKDDGDRSSRSQSHFVEPRTSEVTMKSVAPAPASGVSSASPTLQADGGTIVGQVANRIIEAMQPESEVAKPQQTASDTGFRLKAGGAALKTMLVQLQPEHLGKIEVQMRLVNGQLSVELAASKAETAMQLADDREGLRKLLQGAGFSIDDASVKVVTRESHLARAGQADTSGGQTAGNGGQNAAGQGGERSSSDAGQGGQRQSSSQRGRPSLDETSLPQGRSGGPSVFL